jgi:CDP-diacylglycerol--glycerol-3-phosphate 3-phosphatidyltransferase
MNVKSIKFTIDSLVNKYVLPVIPMYITANHVTSVRLLFVPVLPLVYVTAGPWSAAILFACAAVTDYLDGLLARARGLTQWGKVWDERADKLLIIITLVFIMGVTYGESGSVPEVILMACMLLIIMSRDVLVTIARHNNLTLTKVLWSAKVKAFVQMLACPALILGVHSALLFQLGLLLFLVSTILSVYSAWIYLKPLRKRVYSLVGWQ